MRGQDGWQKAECVAQEGSRTYLVKEKSTGQVFRRNRIDIREEKSAAETPSKDSRESAVDSNTQGNEEQESQAEKKDATGSQHAKQSADFTEQPDKTEQPVKTTVDREKTQTSTPRVQRTRTRIVHPPQRYGVE